MIFQIASLDHKWKPVDQCGLCALRDCIIKKQSTASPLTWLEYWSVGKCTACRVWAEITQKLQQHFTNEQMSGTSDISPGRTSPTEAERLHWQNMISVHLQIKVPCFQWKINSPPLEWQADIFLNQPVTVTRPAFWMCTLMWAGNESLMNDSRNSRSLSLAFKCTHRWGSSCWLAVCGDKDFSLVCSFLAEMVPRGEKCMSNIPSE